MLWLLLVLATVCYAESQLGGQCVKMSGCDSNSSVRITKHPRQSIVHVPFLPLSLNCYGTGDNSTNVYWMRNNSAGQSLELNSSNVNYDDPDTGSWRATLQDDPPETGFPYTYQCIASDKCCNIIRSSSSTVTRFSSTPTTRQTSPTTEPSLTNSRDNNSSSSLTILTSPNSKTLERPGLFSLECTGSGDNTTSVYWIRRNNQNTSIRINSTDISYFSTTGNTIWRARLRDLPPSDKYPYQYQCVALNKCCPTVESGISTVILAPSSNLNPFPSGLCFPFSGDIPRFQFKPDRRSIEISWTYTPKPDETGYRLTWQKMGSTTTSQIKLNITTRKHIAKMLVPYTRYTFQLFILNPKCSNPLPFTDRATTLRDKPSPPRNLRATEIDSTTVNITWLPPEFPNGDSLRYRLFWKKKDVEEDYTSVNISSPRFYIISRLSAQEEYLIEIMAINSFGSGKKVQLIYASSELKNNNSSSSLTIVTSSNTRITLQRPGPVSLECTGSGDNTTTVYWIRWNNQRTSIRINSTDISYFSTIWQARLRDQPPSDKYPYQYQCVALNKCCPTVKSGISTVILAPSPGLDPFSPSICFPSSDNIPKFQFKPDRRSIEISWTYRPQRDDTGYRLKWEKMGSNITSEIKLNITTRKHIAKMLVPHTSYTFQLFILSPKCSKPLAFADHATTLKDKPSPPRNLSATEIDSTTVNITWFPPEFPNGDLLRYRLFWKKKDVEEDYRSVNISSPRFYIISRLSAREEYLIEIMAINSFGSGKKVQLIYASSELKKPRPPLNLTAVEITDTTITVTWLPPKFPYARILRYMLFWKRVDSEKDKRLNVSLSLSHVIRDLVPNTNYSIAVRAISTFGEGKRTPPLYIITLKNPVAKKSSDSTVAIAVGSVIPVILVVILVVFGIFLIRKRAGRKNHKDSLEWFNEMHGITNQESSEPLEGHKPLPDPEPVQARIDNPEEVSYIVLLDDWEILRENIIILEKKLGGGQFGIVKQGLYSSGKNEPELVAVKMLKDGAKELERSDLLTELKILKEVNKNPHPNVLRLIGACSTSEPLLVITEFCSGGNLRKFLVNSRVASNDKSPNYINLASTLTHRQLLKIAVDVACGMIHLSSHKFVHRDLAARNVLIADNDTAKLSDFGLARDIKEGEEYVKSNQNLLPVKWMALESLLHGRFTTASDVWSFGVLLYEIATLGDEPYPGISPYNIVSHVGSGCRMEKPPHCSDEVYAIMTSCWQVNPNDRPSFEEIQDSLHSMLTDQEKSYINVTQMIDEGPLKIRSHLDSDKDLSMRYTNA